MSITVSIQVRLNSVDPGVAFVCGHGFVVAVPLFLSRYSLSSVLTKGFLLFCFHFYKIILQNKLRISKQSFLSLFTSFYPLLGLI